MKLCSNPTPASHGSSEFYRARAAISRFLLQNCGFNIIAVEADWPDAARIDRYVRLKFWSNFIPMASE